VSKFGLVLLLVVVLVAKTDAAHHKSFYEDMLKELYQNLAVQARAQMPPLQATIFNEIKRTPVSARFRRGFSNPE